jgi:hypothetical protein
MQEPADDRCPSVLILGASTRAAAQSAIRAGLHPICADLFADLDLRGCAQVLEVADYPRGLVAAAASAPACPWMYTGGLENQPGIVARISKSRPFQITWGFMRPVSSSRMIRHNAAMTTGDMIDGKYKIVRAEAVQVVSRRTSSANMSASKRAPLRM